MRRRVITDNNLERMDIAYDEVKGEFFLSRQAKEYNHRTGAQTLGKPTILMLNVEQMLKVVWFASSLGEEQ